MAQVETITCVADVGGALTGNYFILHDKNGSVGVWFDHGNAGASIPAGAAACDRQLEIITTANGDSAGPLESDQSQRLQDATIPRGGAKRVPCLDR